LKREENKRGQNLFRFITKGDEGSEDRERILKYYSVRKDK
jgi:hypothetical protein